MIVIIQVYICYQCISIYLHYQGTEKRQIEKIIEQCLKTMEVNGEMHHLLTKIVGMEEEVTDDFEGINPQG